MCFRNRIPQAQSLWLINMHFMDQDERKFSHMAKSLKHFVSYLLERWQFTPSNIGSETCGSLHRYECECRYGYLDFDKFRSMYLHTQT